MTWYTFTNQARDVLHIILLYLFDYEVVPSLALLDKRGIWDHLPANYIYELKQMYYSRHLEFIERNKHVTLINYTHAGIQPCPQTVRYLKHEGRSLTLSELPESCTKLTLSNPPAKGVYPHVKHLILHNSSYGTDLYAIFPALCSLASPSIRFSHPDTLKTIKYENICESSDMKKFTGNFDKLHIRPSQFTGLPNATVVSIQLDGWGLGTIDIKQLPGTKKLIMSSFRTIHIENVPEMEEMIFFNCTVKNGEAFGANVKELRFEACAIFNPIFPAGLEKLSMRGHEIPNLVIPEGLKELALPSIDDIVLPEGLLKLSITHYSSPFAYTLPESLRELNIDGKYMTRSPNGAWPVFYYEGLWKIEDSLSLYQEAMRRHEMNQKKMTDEINETKLKIKKQDIMISHNTAFIVDLIENKNEWRNAYRC